MLVFTNRRIVHENRNQIISLFQHKIKKTICLGKPILESGIFVYDDINLRRFRYPLLFIYKTIKY